MNFVAIGNIVIITITACIALSYFWSHWTYKVFKPYTWLEKKKSKQLHSRVEQIEKKSKDRNRFYSLWYALNQIDTHQTEGQIVIAGVENTELPQLCRLCCAERNIIVIDEFKDKTINVTKENCQGEVTKHDVRIDWVTSTNLRAALGESNKNLIIEGKISDNINRVNTPVALALVDSVDYDDVLASLTHIYPILSEGGMIIVHDYNHDWQTVRYAVDRFEASVSECFVALPDMYGSVIMVKNKMQL